MTDRDGNGRFTAAGATATAESPAEAVARSVEATKEAARSGKGDTSNVITDEDRAILTALEAKHADDDTPKTAADFAGAPKPAEEKPKAEPKKPEPADEPEEEPEADDETELERQRAFLVLRGIPKTTLDKLDDEDIHAMHARLSKFNAEHEALLRERADLKKKNGSATEPKEPAQAEPTLDLDAALASIEDELVDDPREALKTFYTKAVLPTVQAMQQRFDAAMQSMQTQQLQLSEQNLRHELRERFPELADDESWGKFKDAANRLRGSEYTDRDSLIADAARIAGVVATDPTAKSGNPERQRKKLSGQPNPGPNRAPAQALTLDDREWAAFKTLDDGGSREEARRAWNG